VTADAVSPLADFSTLKMEAIRFSETLVNAGCTQRHIPEDDILQHTLVSFLRLLLDQPPYWHYSSLGASFLCFVLFSEFPRALRMPPLPAVFLGVGGTRYSDAWRGLTFRVGEWVADGYIHLSVGLKFKIVVVG
jgi:hypothetical protein